MKRRTFLAGCATVPWLATPSLASADRDALQAMVNANLVYLSPLKSDGQPSSCQAEVWYITLGTDVFVCTASSSWRARAPKLGLRKTRMWFGDLGNWRRANYQGLPSMLVDASIEQDQEIIKSALKRFGEKYPAEWGSWESKFTQGLADGSRTMLRYYTRG